MPLKIAIMISRQSLIYFQKSPGNSKEMHTARIPYNKEPKRAKMNMHFITIF